MFSNEPKVIKHLLNLFVTIIFSATIFYYLILQQNNKLRQSLIVYQAKFSLKSDENKTFFFLFYNKIN